MIEPFFALVDVTSPAPIHTGYCRFRLVTEVNQKRVYVETFKISNDPNFEEKFWDVNRLYLDPPERALVLCCDEKCQCRALERTQPAENAGQVGCGERVRVESPENIIQPATAYIANIYELNRRPERRSQVFGLFNLLCLRKNKGAETLSIIGDL